MKKMKYVAFIVLAVILCVSLVACMPSDPTKAKANLEKEGYTVELLSDKVTVGMMQAVVDELVGADKNCKVVAQVVAAKKDSNLVIVYFDSAKSAKAYYKSFEADAKKELKADEDIGVTGKTVYYGNKDAIKAVK